MFRPDALCLMKSWRETELCHANSAALIEAPFLAVQVLDGVTLQHLDIIPSSLSNANACLLFKINRCMTKFGTLMPGFSKIWLKDCKMNQRKYLNLEKNRKRGKNDGWKFFKKELFKIDRCMTKFGTLMSGFWHIRVENEKYCKKIILIWKKWKSTCKKSLRVEKNGEKHSDEIFR